MWAVVTPAKPGTVDPVGHLVAIDVSSLGQGLREAFFMFWATLWALILGFGLSGAVQAFATPGSMQRLLGNHRLPAVTRASGFGMASSSC